MSACSSQHTSYFLQAADPHRLRSIYNKTQSQQLKTKCLHARSHADTLHMCVRTSICWCIPTAGQDALCYRGLTWSQSACWGTKTTLCFCVSLCAWWGIKMSKIEMYVCVFLIDLGWVVVVVWLWCKPDVDWMQTIVPTGGRRKPVSVCVRWCMQSASIDYKSNVILCCTNHIWQSMDTVLAGMSSCVIWLTHKSYRLHMQPVLSQGSVVGEYWYYYGHLKAVLDKLCQYMVIPFNL